MELVFGNQPQHSLFSCIAGTSALNATTVNTRRSDAGTHSQTDAAKQSRGLRPYYKSYFITDCDLHRGIRRGSGGTR